MSFYEAFRSFFGFPGRGSPRDPLFGARPWDEEEEEDEEGLGPAQPPQDFAFAFGSVPGGAFQELFRDVGDLLGVFGGAWAAAPQPLEPPAAPGRGAASSGRRLRDSMLKLPDGPGPAPGGSAAPARPWSPFPALAGPGLAAPGPKEDGDLDCQVSAGGLGTILRPGQPGASCYCQSISVTQVTLPDGAVEERRTVQDSLGHRETTVRRHGGQRAAGTPPGQDGHCPQELLRVDHRELAPSVGTWAGQDELRALSLPPSALGTFFRRWFSSW